MPSFAELKAKAAKASSSGVEKFQNVRDRNTSVPMKNTNWDPYSGNPAPPPPPPRSLVNRNTKPALPPLPPPPSRTSSTALSPVNRSESVSPAPRLPPRGQSVSPAPPLPSRNKAAAPPPPPPRSSASVSYSKQTPVVLPPQTTGAGAGPPPIVRSTRPGSTQPPRVSPAAPAEEKIDWANLTPEDKQVFFAWLDEFFARFVPPTSSGAVKATDTGDITRQERELPSHAPPPPIRTASKPTSWVRPQAGTSPAFVLSHPPATTHGSSALDLAHYFAPTTHWDSAWYDSPSAPPIPPPVEGTTDHTYVSSWRSRNTSKTTNIGIFFSDLSIFWGSITYDTSNTDPNRGTTRHATYLPQPKPLGRDALIEAHEVYGETVALFAESFVGTGEYCARGECWDLANEALKYFAAYDYIPKPVPSISRTHGHLIFAGRASNDGRQMAGKWRGGDDRVRRGDITEWRRVRIGMGRSSPGGFFTLGDPDHTAVVVCDAVPASTPKDGGDLSPADLGVIVVVEQSVGQPPKRAEYDLGCFQEGEMWIYRPISMQAYLSVSDITAVPPDGLQGLQQL
uniref:BBC1/AIM3 cysteine proteinase-fold domain-containing protein n=1 Tax=Psilocybe cubensis TaxID=181762 RepID=A0A8H7XM18_PSICU